MKNNYFLSNIKIFRSVLIAIMLFVFGSGILMAQTTTIPAGSFIINMGVVPQTVANGLKPYGLIYALLQAKCPVEWVINPSKSKDGVDFTYNGIDYKGGTFIIEKQYRTAAVDALISTWTNPLGLYKVVGVTTTSPVTVPLYLTFWGAPKWTMDLKNGGIATAFFANAGIPASAYGGASTFWKTPDQLDCCDDIFVMPHADPIWSTHRHLWDWVQSSPLDGAPVGTSGCKSGVWLGCHAGSALENMFDNIITDGDPINPNEQTNFLVEKTAPAVGAGPWSTPGNSLILWGSHSSGTLPYTFNNTYSADPVAQYMGSTDAAQLNGSEQIYIPAHASNGWRPNTKVLVYDPDHPNAKSYPSTPLTHVGALLAYGPAFGVEGNGKIFLEAAHNISGTAPANVAAQRAFFNYSFLVAWEKQVLPNLEGMLDGEIVYSGQAYSMSYSEIPNVPPAPVQSYTVTWSSSCGGTFVATDFPGLGINDPSPTFYPPVKTSPTPCSISVTIVDACGRTTFDSHSVIVQCNMQVATTITNPCFGVPSGGAITMTFTNGTGPYTYSWTRVEGGTGSGTLSTEPYTISGLSAGTYTVTATANSGTGCPVTFTVALSASPEINITATPTPTSCNGGNNGAINVNVIGGTPGYTYSWADGPTTLNRSGLIAGTYTLTVTDSKGCSKQAIVEVTQPDAIVITPTIIPVQCYDLNNGQISLAVTGGTGPYTYLWNDGNSSQNRTGLAPGIYSVTVKDANNCTQTLGSLEITQPAAALAATETHVNATCYGSSTGTIDLSVTGGTEAYTYLWTSPGTFTAATQDLSNLAAGTYNVTVTDARGCTTNRQVVITQPAAMALTTNVTQPTCPPDATQNFSDGAITLTVSGGTPGYTYNWTATGTGVVPTGQASLQNLTLLVAGTYTVVVTDSKGCTATTSVTLNYLNPNPVKPGTINH